MIPNLSLFRAAALTGAAAFLFSLAHVTPAAAQTSTRYVTTCTAQAQAGQWGKTCTMTVPAGKVFIIESATAHGSVPHGQRIVVDLQTKFQNSTRLHPFVAGLGNADEFATSWTGAIPGTIFSEGGYSGTEITFHFSRWGSSAESPLFRVALSGRLEDM